ncbi:MAG: hypothetical protein ACHQ03_12185, partial [Candidatus Bathyarchaeia archaeon]
SMPKYVVISNHPPNSCPSANKVLAEKNKNLSTSLAPLLQKYKVNPHTMLHLDPGHKVLWVLDAPNAEAVRDLIYESGLSQWNDFEFYMTSTLEEITATVEKLTPVW